MGEERAPVLSLMLHAVGEREGRGAGCREEGGGG